MFQKVRLEGRRNWTAMLVRERIRTRSQVASETLEMVMDCISRQQEVTVGF